MPALASCAVRQADACYGADKHGASGHGQVSVDNIDRDLFGKGLRGAMYRPSDNTQHRYLTAAHDLVRGVYEDNLVRGVPAPPLPAELNR